jgi:hypothetical protein
MRIFATAAPDEPHRIDLAIYRFRRDLRALQSGIADRHPVLLAMWCPAGGSVHELRDAADRRRAVLRVVRNADRQRARGASEHRSGDRGSRPRR